jgi:hypothetical protein
LRAALTLATALLWQLGALESSGPTAEPQHLRYERQLALPPSASGQSCTVLDAGVYTHAASAAGNDLRLFATQPGASATEVPFNLSESETQPAEVETAAVQNLGMRHGDIVFDLAMPHRAYTQVDLHLNARNFLATATVTGSNSDGPTTALGAFALFDLTRQGLSRSTALPLQESTFSTLHIALHPTGLDGQPLPSLDPGLVQGADVPPSREAQTLYTTVAESTSFERKGRQTIVALHVPAHVPIERVAFVLDPAFSKNFLREVQIIAAPDSAAAHAATEETPTTESITGEISRVHMTAPDPASPAINSEHLTIDSALGANLDGPAKIVIAIDNGDDSPLPLRAIQLQMRQRYLCFDASSSESYTLLYGDPMLHAPVYDYARLFQGSARPVFASLGPEQLNPRYALRADQRPYTERHPELLWIGLLGVVAALGATALQSVKRQGRK